MPKYRKKRKHPVMAIDSRLAKEIIKVQMIFRKRGKKITKREASRILFDIKKYFVLLFFLFFLPLMFMV